MKQKWLLLVLLSRGRNLVIRGHNTEGELYLGCSVVLSTPLQLMSSGSAIIWRILSVLL